MHVCQREHNVSFTLSKEPGFQFPHGSYWKPFKSQQKLTPFTFIPKQQQQKLADMSNTDMMIILAKLFEANNLIKLTL